MAPRRQKASYHVSSAARADCATRMVARRSRAGGWGSGRSRLGSPRYFDFDGGAPHDYSNPNSPSSATGWKANSKKRVTYSARSFYESEQTLWIVMDQKPNSQLCRLPRTACSGEATIDARILWDLLRDLIKLRVKNPAIQFRPENQDRRPARKIRGGDDLRLACGFRGNALIGSPPKI